MLEKNLLTLGLGTLLLAAACGSDHDPGDADAAGAALDGSAHLMDAMSPTHEGGDDAGSTGAEHDASSRDAAAQDASQEAQGPKVDRTNPALHEFSLDPKAVDPSVADSLSTQYAQLDTRSAPLGLLVVFLPGANNVPRDWRDHGRQLAAYGFHVLIPHYNNRWSTGDTCTGGTKTCSDDTRWEALTGEDTSTAIVIPRADSVEGRVIAMLEHLSTSDPGGDWGYYLSKDKGLLYDRTIIAGISHGAASAGMYATKRAFVRNVMHSSGAAGPSSATKQTPVSAWYGFAHTEDPAYDAIVGSWDKSGLPGTPTSIDGASAPFGGSHRLITSADSTYPHGSTCVHSSSPKDTQGHYLFDAAWRYLYGVPGK
ncbi:MAG: hypothetical protein QM778_22090 [Myxococcales bacterium]